MKLFVFLALCATATCGRLRDRTTLVASSAGRKGDPDSPSSWPTSLDSHVRQDWSPQSADSALSASVEAASVVEREQQSEVKETQLKDTLGKENTKTMEKILPDKLSKGDTPREIASNSLFLWTVTTCCGLLCLLFIFGFVKLVLAKTPNTDSYGVYDKIMLNHVHQRFASNFELAGRGALCCVLMGIPFFMPRGFSPVADWLVEENLYSPLAVIYYIYTLYLTVGDTVYFARCGFLGTLLAVLDCWLLYGLKPSGVEDVHYADHWMNHTARFWVFGVFHCTLVTFCIFWFNMASLTRVFFLTTAVWFWMDFLNPGNVDNYSKGFVINPYGSGTRMLNDCFVGCVFALLAVMLPRPFWAIDRARTGVKESIMMMQYAWGDMVQAVCVTGLSPVIQESVTFRLRQVQQLMADAQSDLDTAYYECFRLGSREQSRKMLRAVIKATEESDAQIQSTLCCMGTSEQSELMQHLMKPIDTLIKRANKVINACTDGAIRGGLSEDEASLLNEATDSMEATINDITADFVKHSKGGPTEQGMDDNTFLASVCCYGLIVSNLAKKLAKDHAGTEPLKNKVLQTTMETTFDKNVLFDGDVLQTAAKDTFKILLGFWVGYFGYMKVIPQYTPAVASTMALLLGSFAGSAMVKNMQRLQGVVFGMVVGQIFYAAFGWCSWWGYLGVMASLFGLVSVGLYLYYNSTEHGTLGCLLAAFGAQCMLQGCKESGNHIDRSAYYSNILVTVVAVLLVCAIDTVTARKRASHMAYESLVDAWRRLDTAFNCLLDPQIPKKKRAEGALRKGIADAKNLSVEAAKEPRFWRTPYRVALFDSVIQVAYKIRFSLSLAEFVATDPNATGGGKSPRSPAANVNDKSQYNRVAALPSFVKVRDLVLKKMRQVEKHFELFIHETDHQKALSPKVDPVKEFEDALAALFKDLGKDAALSKESKNLAAIEDSPSCQISVVLNATSSIMMELCALDVELYNSARSSY